MGFLSGWLEKRESALQEERKERVEQALLKLSLIPAGEPLVKMAREKSLYIRITPDVPPDAIAVYRPSRFIDISPACPERQLPAALAHELRHVDQGNRGLSMHRKMNIHDNLIITRFSEADAYAYEAQVAWELARHAVDPAAWKNYQSREPRLAKAYLVALETDPAADESGKALHAVFHAWFGDDGLKNSYDADALRESREQIERVRQGLRANTLQDRKRAENAPPLMSVGHLREFGAIAGGRNYLESVDTRRPVFISMLSVRHQAELRKLVEEATACGKNGHIPCEASGKSACRPFS